MKIQTLKNNIIHQMVRELSTLGYGYHSIVEGCFEASQRFIHLQVPEEHKNQLKKECIDEAIQILKRV